MTIRHRRAALGAVALLAVTAACGPAPSSAAAPPPPPGPAAIGDQTVLITDEDAFAPDALRITAGSTMTWRWDDGAGPHNVTFDTFASDTQTEGVYRHTFDEPGTFAYRCTLHPEMTGLVVVE